MGALLILIAHRLLLQPSAAYAAASPDRPAVPDDDGDGDGDGDSRPRFPHASSASSLFPPSEERYDPWIFDPRSMFGAPLGGYARSSRSRIAALPLRLVGGGRSTSPRSGPG